MYNFFLKKEMNEMLDEFEELCSSVTEIKLNSTENKIQKYDCKNELGIIVYYLEGQAIAYVDDEDGLCLLKDKDDKKNVEILEEITCELQEKIYLEFDCDASDFAKAINREMYRKHDYIKEQYLSIEEQEALDLKEWKREEARQAYAMNRGVV